MAPEIQQHFDHLGHADHDLQYASFQYLLRATDQRVSWIDEVWDELFRMLRHKDNHLRAIAAQLISNLAKTDGGIRLPARIDELMEVTKDKKFVTARHSLQSLWKIGVVNPVLQRLIVDRLSHRFMESANEKNGTLVRYDILGVMKHIYDHVNDPTLKEQALTLIGEENDLKYQKKYRTVFGDRKN